MPDQFEKLGSLEGRIILKYVWEYALILPICCLLYHIFVLVIYAKWWLFVGWSIELLWILLYLLAIFALLRPKRMGYIYLGLLLTGNLGWEIYVSYLLDAEYRLFLHTVPGTLLILLYYFRHNFAFKANRIALVAIVAFVFLLVESSLLGAKVIDQKYRSEAIQWRTEHVYSGALSPKWCGENQIIARFSDSLANDGSLYDEMQKLMYSMFPSGIRDYNVRPGLFDLTTRKLTKISLRNDMRMDEERQNCSLDGQWISYNKIQSKDNKPYSEYFRYHVPTGKSETVFIAQGKNLNFLTPSPNGSMLFQVEKIDNNPEFWVKQSDAGIKVITKKVGKNEQFVWAWMPDGKGWVITSRDRGFLEFFSLDGKLIRTIPLPKEEIARIVVGPDEKYIYIRTRNPDELYYCKLDSAQPEWQSTNVRMVWEFSVGSNGLLVYTVSSLYGGQFTYLLGQKALKERGIWLYRPGMRYSIRLTNDADSSASVSADGKRIVFSRMDDWLDHSIIILQRK